MLVNFLVDTSLKHELVVKEEVADFSIKQYRIHLNEEASKSGKKRSHHSIHT